MLVKNSTVFCKVIRTFSILSGLIISIGSVQADTKISIETDPATFAFEGYAAHVRVNPKGMEKWRLGVGLYSLKFPDELVSLNPENKDKGWNVELSQGLGIFSEYYFGDSAKGGYVGLQVALQEYSIENDNSIGQDTSYNNILIIPSFGYRWFPTDHAFYVTPWIGVGYTSKVSGENKIDDQSFDIAPILTFAAVHIGYDF
jgi:hypothetical protein